MSYLSKKQIPTEQTLNLTTITNTNEQITVLPTIERRTNPKASQRLAKYTNTVLFENHSNIKVDELSHRKNFNIYITESSLLQKKSLLQPSIDERLVTEVSESEKEKTGPTDNETSLLNKLSKRQMQYRAQVCNSQSPQRININQLNKEKGMSIRDYVIKTREINAMKYSLELKKERALRISEYRQNEIETINMTMKSMEEARKLFDENFCIKFSEYNKKLSIELDKERVVASTLYQKVNNLQKNINQLEMRINKKKNDKESMERWIIFQKQVNTLHPSPESIVINSGNAVNPSQQFIPSIQVPLIYSTPEEFISVINNGETKSRILLDNLNSINFSIQYLKKEKEEVHLHNTQSIIGRKKLVKEKEEMLEKVKYVNDVLLKEHRSVQALSKESHCLKMLKVKLRGPIVGQQQFLPNKNIKLKKKIDVLYSTTKCLLAIGTGNEDPDEVITKAKQNWSMEKTMLYKLTQIEKAINSLMRYHAHYDSHQDIYGALLKSIYARIELQHKEQSAKRSKEEDVLKLSLLKEKIEERNNKVYFLPFRRVDMYPVNKSTMNNKKTKVVTKKKELEFEDFMYDINV